MACGLALPQAAKADIGLCSSVPNNLILNCGFETGDFSDWTQGGNLAFTSVTGALTVGGSGGTTFNPNSGNFQAELGPTNSDGTLSQTFVTKTGDVYQVQFYMAGEGGTGSDFSAFINANTLLATNPAPNQSYTLYTYTITAGGPSTTLQFTISEAIRAFSFSDDVSVNDTTGGEHLSPHRTLCSEAGWQAYSQSQGVEGYELKFRTCGHQTAFNAVFRNLRNRTNPIAPAPRMPVIQVEGSGTGPGDVFVVELIVAFETT